MAGGLDGAVDAGVLALWAVVRSENNSCKRSTSKPATLICKQKPPEAGRFFFYCAPQQARAVPGVT